MCGQSLSRKNRKRGINFAEKPSLWVKQDVLINCSRLLIGRGGGGICLTETNPALITHSFQTQHTPASRSFFREGACWATPEQMEGSADQFVHMARMIFPTFLSGRNSFFFFPFHFFKLRWGRRQQLGNWSFPIIQMLGGGGGQKHFEVGGRIAFQREESPDKINPKTNR